MAVVTKKLLHSVLSVDGGWRRVSACMVHPVEVRVAKTIGYKPEWYKMDADRQAELQARVQLAHESGQLSPRAVYGMMHSMVALLSAQALVQRGWTVKQVLRRLSVVSRLPLPVIRTALRSSEVSAARTCYKESMIHFKQSQGPAAAGLGEV